MKKLLLGATILLGSVLSTSAQTTIFFQNFEATTTSMPSGWSEQKSTYDPDNLGWLFNNTFPGQLATHVPAHTYYAFIDDFDNNLNTIVENKDTLYTPVINCSANAHVFISFDLMFALQAYNGNEVASLLVSANGGSTWTTIAPELPTNGFAWQDSLTYDLSSVAGGQSNVMIAFTYDDNANSNVGPGLGIAIDNIDVYQPINYDVSVTSQDQTSLLQVGTPYNFSGTIYNYAGDSIVEMAMSYSVNGGPVIAQTITGITGFNALTSYNWSMNSSSAAFTPSSTGTYKIKFWADNLNGSYIDQNHANDTLVANFYAVNTVETRQAVYEEFTGQSCVWCMIAAPNMDSVTTNNATNTNILRYHVPIPGRDFMYNESANVVTPRKSYYSVNSAPNGFLDGTYLDPSAYGNPPDTFRYSSYTLQTDNKVGSPFSIDITSHGFDAAADSFYVTVNITAQTAFAAGLKAQVALTIDSVVYPQDLSSDDPQEEFAAPIGSSNQNYAYPGCPDSYFPYLLNFTHVVENMFPSGNGTTLPAFTAGLAQPYTFGWKQNHPWGQYPNGSIALGDSTVYHASPTGQFVIFVQTSTAIDSEGIPAKYIFQSASAPVTGIVETGMQQISQGVYLQMYPNPTNNNTTLAFKLNNSQNVNVTVYNMLGEEVYSNNEGRMSSGQHSISIDGSGLQSGVYFVRFNTDNVSTTKKLVIQH